MIAVQTLKKILVQGSFEACIEVPWVPFSTEDLLPNLLPPHCLGSLAGVIQTTNYLAVVVRWYFPGFLLIIDVHVWIREPSCASACDLICKFPSTTPQAAPHIACTKPARSLNTDLLVISHKTYAKHACNAHASHLRRECNTRNTCTSHLQHDVQHEHFYCELKGRTAALQFCAWAAHALHGISHWQNSMACPVGHTLERRLWSWSKHGWSNTVSTHLWNWGTRGVQPSLLAFKFFGRFCTTL